LCVSLIDKMFLSGVSAEKSSSRQFLSYLKFSYSHVPWSEKHLCNETFSLVEGFLLLTVSLTDRFYCNKTERASTRCLLGDRPGTRSQSSLSEPRERG
jgi:hypothetical protein